MTGPLFMRPYVPHAGHIIKMADETRSGTLPVTDDAELFTPLKPSTIYMVRIMLIFMPTSSNVWRPACTSAVDFAALHAHRGVATQSGQFWYSTSAGEHWADVVDTTRFNALFNLPGSNMAGRNMTGMIQTSSSGGTFSIQWGGGSSATRTLKAGSFLYLQEAVAYSP